MQGKHLLNANLGKKKNTKSYFYNKTNKYKIIRQK